MLNLPPPLNEPTLHWMDPIHPSVSPFWSASALSPFVFDLIGAVLLKRDLF